MMPIIKRVDGWAQAGWLGGIVGRSLSNATPVQAGSPVSVTIPANAVVGPLSREVVR